MNNCPVSFQLVNEKIVRANAIIITLILIIFLSTSSEWLIFFLALDFLIRGFFKPRFSLLTFASTFIVNLFKLIPSPIDAAPKIFSARIGFIFCFAIGIFSAFNSSISIYLTSGLLFCTVLEGFFGYCVGCKFYSLKEKFLSLNN